jgi:hypothetical protein
VFGESIRPGRRSLRRTEENLEVARWSQSTLSFDGTKDVGACEEEERLRGIVGCESRAEWDVDGNLPIMADDARVETTDPTWARPEEAGRLGALCVVGQRQRQRAESVRQWWHEEKRGQGTDLVLCALGVDDGEKHITVAIALETIRAEDLAQTRGGSLGMDGSEDGSGGRGVVLTCSRRDMVVATTSRKSGPGREEEEARECIREDGEGSPWAQQRERECAICSEAKTKKPGSIFATGVSTYS